MRPCIICSRPVSRILYGFPSFILSRHHWRDHTTYPPALDEQSFAPVYMVFQPIRCTASGVATGTGELLPHLFTLPPYIAAGRGYFLLHCQTLAGFFPLGSMVLSVVRTFLPILCLRSERDDGTACCVANLHKNE
jgi:hypothetical protein